MHAPLPLPVPLADDRQLTTDHRIVVRRLDRRTHEACVPAPAPEGISAVGWTPGSSRRVTREKVAPPFRPARDGANVPAGPEERKMHPPVVPPGEATGKAAVSAGRAPFLDGAPDKAQRLACFSCVNMRAKLTRL
ncbi:MAG: hypothetical protein KatS3mg119_2379 [Rhodothalassiaceae bacterium]|nr:MAG: hypothetical protein KatS3mg119_2379 [Rhodothalassiaceae bacterium]